MIQRESLPVGAEVLAPEARADRVASWGPPPPEAYHLADRIEAQFDRSVQRAANAEERRVFAPAAAPPTIPDTRLTGAAVDALGRIAEVRTDDAARRACSLGKSLPDLVDARGASLARACDAVVRPRTEQELDRVLAWCCDADVTVVPVGGGTTVSGGIEPIGRTAGDPVVALDTTRLTALVDFDEPSGVATFQAGVRGPDLEAALAPFGRTLGHIPQSFELSTLGGWIATRSAGQASLQVGKIERLVASLRLASPEGELVVPHLPAHGAGPDLAELVMGSEGTFGVVTRAGVRVRQRPGHVRFAAWAFPSFEQAAEAARTLVQLGLPRPAMLRLSDSEETAFNVGASLPGALRGGAGRTLARAAGLEHGALAIATFLGSSHEIGAAERSVARHLRHHGGIGVGPMPARSWFRARFVQPYVRDLLLDRGLLVDTLETSVRWSGVAVLHEAVGEALRSTFGDDRCRVACHLSHLYHDGASAYFTMIARPRATRPLAIWRAAKRAVHEAIAAAGGSASHQHGVGTMHHDLYAAAVPQLGIDALRAARLRFDAGGRCNPGKLFDAPAGGQVARNAVTGGGSSGADDPAVLQEP